MGKLSKIAKSFKNKTHNFNIKRVRSDFEIKTPVKIPVTTEIPPSSNVNDFSYPQIINLAIEALELEEEL
jgi:hypothetical protein